MASNWGGKSPQLLPRKPPRKVGVAYAPDQAFAQLSRLLDRHRLALPFPVDTEVFVRSLLPPIEVPALPEQLDNFAKSVHLDLKAYVSVGDPDSNYNTYFWVRMKKPMPVPVASTDCYIMWKQNRYYQSVFEWWKKAVDLDTRIDNVKEGFKDYFDEIQNAAEMRVSWQELLKFVKLRGPVMAHVTRERKLNIEEAMRRSASPQFRQYAMEMLSAATMLDSENEAVAWVGLN